MPRRGAPSKPTIRTHRRKDGETSFYARHTAYGRRYEYVIGSTPSMTLPQAHDALRQIVAQVELGIWRPPGHRTATAGPPLLHEILSDAAPDDSNGELT